MWPLRLNIAILSSCKYLIFHKVSFLPYIYSVELGNMLWTMLQVEEKNRPDFLELKALYP